MRTYGPPQLLESLRIESTRGVLYGRIFLATFLLRMVTGHNPVQTSHKREIQVNKRKGISSQI